ncbi:GRAS family transcription factor [Actinidia rufa]|uniref:GRAS family transcription factor n=1 Tax=Actinidia rufa TaxID=165716 RepID=A0A7J0F1B6_9ERIC|nr:GRAS family transcription factor [Actinidia rufa]
MLETSWVLIEESTEPLTLSLKLFIEPNDHSAEWSGKPTQKGTRRDNFIQVVFVLQDQPPIENQWSCYRWYFCNYSAQAGTSHRKHHRKRGNAQINGSRGRKNHHREDYTLEEERSSKQAAVYEEEVELSEMFDQVLLFTNVKGGPDCYEVPDAQSEASKNLQQNGQPHASRGGKTRAKKQGNKEEVVDLTTLLINCAQSVAADDRRTANEQLKRIRQHSSLSGDGSQRLANIFADGLEARLAGTGSQIYAALASKRISATDKLKAYQLYLLACPFKKINELKLAVSCLFRFENLLDETVVDNNPRDAVLKLIRKTNPDIFIHSVINGSYSAPFFVTRFREALFHYSSLFDMFEANVPREHPQRTIFEKEFYGREVMNVIACEGLERVERPETYKQWQVRNTKAGFRILPLDIEILEKLKSKVKKAYHKDFVINEASQWMLQGWKGRVFCASSCWVPA